VSGVVLLSDAANGSLLAVLNAAAVTALRTGAAAVLAAETLGRDAVALAEETDLLNTRGDTLADYAEVLLLAGRRREASTALEQATEHFERKGNTTSLERVQRSVRELADRP